MDAGWQRWLYQKWNERLVEYCFRNGHEFVGGAVERIPATPEELREVVGDPTAEPSEVVRAFVSSAKRRMPEGVSFEGFCTNYMAWTPDSERSPRFFAMLWLTCLVAYGYPDGRSGFHNRMKGLFGRVQQMDCLPDLWRDAEAWTRNRARIEEDFRSLKLPPDDDFRTNIGHSWFLAFPHHRDRRKLRELLELNDLVGDEPPVAPVVSVLERNKDEFSASFRKDLEEFAKSFLDTDADMRESPFWRAVRQEALLPVGEKGSEARRALSNTALMAALEDDELYVYVACSEETRLPSGFSATEIDDVIDGFSRYVIDDAADAEEMGMDRAALAAFEGTLKVPKARVHARRGVLVFQEVMTHEYRLVGGADANQAEVALVRDDKVGAFRQAYGGRVQPSRLRGWKQVTGCKVLVRPESPRGLEKVRHLQETMVPKSVSLAEGIRTEEGFYAFPGFLPVVRFDGATKVEIIDGGGNLIGGARRSAANRNDWHLPEDLVEQAPGEWIVRVGWIDDGGHERISEKSLVFVDRQTSHTYKRLGIGRYHIESCSPGQGEIFGREEIPLRITAAEISDTAVHGEADSIGDANGSSYWSGVEPDYRVGHFADALAALSVRRSGVRQNLLFELFSVVLELEVRDNPVLFYDLVRGWVESGAIDVALKQGRRASYISARRPRFVAFRSGDRVRASLVGLVPSVLETRTRQAVEARGIVQEDLLPPCEWLPKVTRVESGTATVLQKLSTDLDLPPPCWLRWPNMAALEENLDIRPDHQSLREDPVSSSFELAGRWDWYQGRFVREKRPNRGIRVQMRTHPERSPVYVVVVDGEDYCWSYIRNWPLLLAYLLNVEWLGEDDPIFESLSRGPMVRPREADVYLPLPVGRMCAVLGDGLSGPMLSNDRTTVEGYQYPLGFGYREMLRDWISSTGCVGFSDEESDE